MGLSCSCLEPPIPEEIKKILKTLEDKAPDIKEKCFTNKDDLDKKKAKILQERANNVEKAKDKSEDELKELLKKYNKKELNLEKKYISNELDKMHSLWEIGIDLADPLKDVVIDQLKKKLDKIPEFGKAAVNSQISEIKAYSPRQFLDSKYGKPLKDALIKQGMNKTLLENYKKELLEDRNKRRKEEREKFSYVKQNEFPPEDEFEFKTDELYDSIFDEYKDAFLSSINKNLLKIEENDDDNDEE